jgi:hypothetical protein
MMRPVLLVAIVLAVVGCQPGVAVTPPASDASASPSPSPSVAYDAPRATPVEVQTRLQAGESFLVVDVRAKVSYDAGHIKDAVNHPWANLKLADPGFPRDKFILLYCT